MSLEQLLEGTSHSLWWCRILLTAASLTMSLAHGWLAQPTETGAAAQAPVADSTIDRQDH